MPHASVNGISIFYEIIGNSDYPTLVMTHGLGGHGRAYENLIPEFSKRYKLLLWDMRGHGQSDRPKAEDGVYTRDQHASDLAGLLDSLGIDQAHIHGHSLGGLVAQQFVISYPEKTKSLIIQDSSAEIKEEYVAGWDDRIQNVLDLGLEGIPVDYTRGWGKKFSDSNKEYIDARHLESVQRNDLFVYVEDMRISGTDLYAEPLAPQLPDIKCPVLIICGEEDGTTPPGGHVRMHRAINNSELVIIPFAGHFPNVETQEEYSTAILSFLDKIN
ncbi:MAG: alpha/beta fold hydrolase [Dehalococcoidia bacterium]